MKTKQSLYQKPFTAIVTALLVGFVGTYLIVSGHAASSTVSVEVEHGTISGGSSIVNDPSASEGKAVKFAAATPAPQNKVAVGVVTHPLWAINSDAQNRAIIDKLAAAHVTWTRIDIGWINIFPTNSSPTGTWAITKIDNAVNYANSKGIKVLGIWWLTPGWANGNQSTSVCPTDPATYAASAQWAANHWAGKIQAWEVWNEPDPSQSFWQCTQQQYVNLLKAAYPAFHAGDASTKVVLAGPSSNDDAWIDGIYQLGGKGSFDVVSTHPYNSPANLPPNTPDTDKYKFTHVAAVRQVSLNHGDDKPIWLTEFGWSDHTNTAGSQPWQLGVTAAQQGDYFVQAIQWINTNATYVKVMFWYEAVNEAEGSTSHINNYGLLHTDLSPKPSYTTIQNFLASY